MKKGAGLNMMGLIGVVLGGVIVITIIRFLLEREFAEWEKNLRDTLK